MIASATESAIEWFVLINSTEKFAPAFALSLGPLATISRLTRTSMLDVLSSDYIKTAKAKGLSNRMIIWRHALRNAIMPVLTVLGPQIASVLTGSFVIEKIFNKGESGKKHHSGIGLWEVRNYIKKSKNLDLFTTKNSKFFIQELSIYDIKEK